MCLRKKLTAFGKDTIKIKEVKRQVSDATQTCIKVSESQDGILSELEAMEKDLESDLCFESNSLTDIANLQLNFKKCNGLQASLQKEIIAANQAQLELDVK